MIYQPASGSSLSGTQGDLGASSDLAEGAVVAKTGKRDMGRRIGFVRQQDFLVEHLTGEYRSSLGDVGEEEHDWMNQLLFDETLVEWKWDEGREADLPSARNPDICRPTETAPYPI